MVPTVLCLLSIAAIARAGSKDSTTHEPSRQNVLGSRAALLAERAHERTNLIVRNVTLRGGRLVLLTCTRLCAEYRTQTHRWITEFNAAQRKEHGVEDYLDYRFHMLKKPLAFMNDSNSYLADGPKLYYLIGDEHLLYPGPLNDQERLFTWLRSVDTPPIIEPTTAADLDRIFNMTCAERYMLYSAHRKCELPNWRTISSLINVKKRIQTIVIPRPIKDDLFASTLYLRMSNLQEEECRFLVLLQHHEYSGNIKAEDQNEVMEIVNDLVGDGSECALQTKHTHNILPPLTDLQKEFYTSERHLVRFERNTKFIVIGVASGISVVALAISIFWGLNGTAFAGR